MIEHGPFHITEPSGSSSDRWTLWYGLDVINHATLPAGSGPVEALNTCRHLIEDWLEDVSGYTINAKTWIVNLLSPACLASNSGKWKAPSYFDICHVVGTGSLTGLSVDRASALLGIPPERLTFYLLPDNDGRRSPMTYQMWNKLLVSTGIRAALRP